MFPSLLITQDQLIPQGSYAQSLQMHLQPNQKDVQALDELLQAKHVGLVAHFYMDPEIQGVLGALTWPHVFVADSLQMGSQAVAMAQAGCRAIVVMGVDFMAENIRAMLDHSGFAQVPLYRLASSAIGCSLAEAAQKQEYLAYLLKAAKSKPALHVIYINTGLEIKAQAQGIIPTITCTSSNVVKMILQAFAQVPNLHIFFGPDSYMGANLKNLFAYYATLSDELIQKIHSDYSQQKMRDLVVHFEYFKQGTCYVHEMFGANLVQKIQSDYPQAFYTAHLEVPGEMFALAFEAQKQGRGVIGSTSNILNFIKAQVAMAEPHTPKQQFVLGTEAGMAAAIVPAIQKAIQGNLAVEIIFPVDQEAMTSTPSGSVPVTPGVEAGDGCSVAGSCASCKFMKMNTLEGLLYVLKQIDSADSVNLESFKPRRVVASELGFLPIMAMQEFQSLGKIGKSLHESLVV
jgi:quinolinate synthase